ncbi:MAG: GIY-YIG nuclease family protein [Patescibacteria group bacterium]|jgi:putative endonuclease
MKAWHVYIVRCRDSSLYTGIALDVKQRVEKHNSGEGAKYTRSRRPVKLVRKEKHATESRARKREAEIKAWPRLKKLNLVRYGNPNGLKNKKKYD